MKKSFLTFLMSFIAIGLYAQVDCNGVMNGPALVDNNGCCQRAYIYEFFNNHQATFIDDTVGLYSPSNEIGLTTPGYNGVFTLDLSTGYVNNEWLILPNSQMNPYWNNTCHDCNGIENGASLIDDCGVCQQAYVYDFSTNAVTFIDDTSGIVLGATEMIVFPEDINNLYWNASCFGGIEGYAFYNNTISTPLENIMVYLFDSNNTLIDSITTDENGHYVFSYSDSSFFTIQASANNIPFGGVNSTDGLAVQNHFIGNSVLSGLNLAAVDVNTSGTQTSVDALLIRQRFVGIINQFDAADWYFEMETDTSTGLTLYNLRGIIMGDVDGSYQPTN